MTTITQKKHYKTPHCVFISLEEEAELLSVSNPVEEGEEAGANAGGSAWITPQNDINITPTTPWGENPWQ